VLKIDPTRVDPKGPVTPEQYAVINTERTRSIEETAAQYFPGKIDINGEVTAQERGNIGKTPYGRTLLQQIDQALPPNATREQYVAKLETGDAGNNGIGAIEAIEALAQGKPDDMARALDPLRSGSDRSINFPVDFNFDLTDTQKIKIPAGAYAPKQLVALLAPQMDATASQLQAGLVACDTAFPAQTATATRSIETRDTAVTAQQNQGVQATTTLDDKPVTSYRGQTYPASNTPRGQVRQAQADLETLGIGSTGPKNHASLADGKADPAKMDGIVGPATTETIQKFQEASHLPVTGELDPKTMETLHAAAEASRSHASEVTTQQQQSPAPRRVIGPPGPDDEGTGQPAPQPRSLFDVVAPGILAATAPKPAVPDLTAGRPSFFDQLTQPQTGAQAVPTISTSFGSDVAPAGTDRIRGTVRENITATIGNGFDTREMAAAEKFTNRVLGAGTVTENGDFETAKDHDQFEKALGTASLADLTQFNKVLKGARTDGATLANGVTDHVQSQRDAGGQNANPNRSTDQVSMAR
jgi:hypothetical protein